MQNTPIGNTPLVHLDRCTEHPHIQIWAKLEEFNLTGSVKARAAWNIIDTAEKNGLLRPNGCIVDASSGNTGIAYAAIAAMKGYTLNLCIPSNVNTERKKLLQAYGANCIFTSPLEGSDGAIRTAQRLAKENPDWFYADQYNNEANWLAHYHGTGPEIWKQSQGKVTHFVSSLGTSGTFVGTSRYLKEISQNRILCYTVEPDSPFHGLEGMKHMASAIVPGIYDSSLATEHLESPTEESLELIPWVAKTQGLLIGPSCAAALYAAMQLAHRLQHTATAENPICIVLIFADSGERYLSEKHIWSTTTTGH